MLDSLFDWLGDHQALLWSLGAASVAMFIASLFILPAVIVRIRPDYFAHEHRPPPRWAHRTPTVRIMLHVIKNLMGSMLLLAGLAMLVLPGQGLLSIAIGFFLLDLPGKYRFERWLVSRRWIHRPLNWLRYRARREPLIIGRALVSASAANNAGVSSSITHAGSENVSVFASAGTKGHHRS